MKYYSDDDDCAESACVVVGLCPRVRPRTFASAHGQSRAGPFHFRIFSDKVSVIVWGLGPCLVSDHCVEQVSDNLCDCVFYIVHVHSQRFAMVCMCLRL